MAHGELQVLRSKELAVVSQTKVEPAQRQIERFLRPQSNTRFLLIRISLNDLRPARAVQHKFVQVYKPPGSCDAQS